MGLLIGAVYALDEVTSPIIQQLLASSLNSVWNLYVSYLVLPFISFLLAPCLLFGIVYAWGKSRVTRLFREKYGTYILNLFFGSTIGFLIYFPFIYLIGDTLNVPNLPSLVIGIFQYFQAIIGVAVNLVLTGFGALTLAYFRSERAVVQNNQESSKSPETIMPQHYPPIP